MLEPVAVRLAVAVLDSEGVPVADCVADTDADSLAVPVVVRVPVDDGDVVTADVRDRVGDADVVAVAVGVALHACESQQHRRCCHTHCQWVAAGRCLSALSHLDDRLAVWVVLALDVLLTVAGIDSAALALLVVEAARARAEQHLGVATQWFPGQHAHAAAATDMTALGRT